MLCPCGCSGCVTLLCRHIPLWPVPVPPHNKYRHGGRKGRRREWRAWTGCSDKHRDVKRGWPGWDHHSCDAMETLVASTWTLHDHFELKVYKNNMAWTLFELMAEYSLKGGYGLISSPYSRRCSVYKHGEAEITKCLKWGSVIVVRIRGRGVFKPLFVCCPHPRNLCVLNCRAPDLQINKWKK